MEDREFWILIELVGGLIGVGLLMAFASWINGFSQELKYLNNEINRTKGEEQRYWKHQKRRLWLSLIPFVHYRNDH